MDYSKFDKIAADGSGVRDKETTSVSKKPKWATLIESKDVSKLRQLVEEGGLDVKGERWTGERQRWQTPGNFQDEWESGTYTVLGYAVCWNKPEVVALLLELGADPAQTITVMNNERTVLSVAQSRNYKHVVKLLKARLGN